MIKQSNNIKILIILIAILPVGLFFFATNIGITVISVDYSEDKNFDINIEYTVKNAVNITTQGSVLFYVTILSIRDENGKDDNPEWRIGTMVFMITKTHELQPGTYSSFFDGQLISTREGLGIYSPEAMQIPTEITFRVHIGEDFYSSPYTAYLDK